jgi:hypothetical protein
MIVISPQLYALPILHGRLIFAELLRDTLLKKGFSDILLELPSCLQEPIAQAVYQLPEIHGVVASNTENQVLIPADPGDAMIEAFRDNRHPRCLGPHILPKLYETPDLPDPGIISQTGLEAWYLSAFPYLQYWLDTPNQQKMEAERQHLLKNVRTALNHIKTNTSPLLLICRADTLFWLQNQLESPENEGIEHIPEVVQTQVAPIDPDHLFFALGEMPFWLARHEAARQDLFAPRPHMETILKELFLHTRRDWLESSHLKVRTSPHRIQITLQYARNLAWLEKRLQPDLFDLIYAAQGVFGDDFARKVLRAARYWPWFRPDADPMIKLGPNRLKLGEQSSEDYTHLFDDTRREWKNIQLRPEPTPPQQQQYRYAWDQNRSCSHVPEDRRIESFNSNLRRLTIEALSEGRQRSQPFTASLLDGLDLRNTLRNWHTRQLWVQETPPAPGSVDTVVILFDQSHDDLYPHQMTWYAEHNEESTLSFYSTDPMTDLIGPGIARARYGGLSLLFPPIAIPDIFTMTRKMPGTLAEKLLWGALRFSQEKNVGFIAAAPPSLRMTQMAREFGKHLVFTPLSRFSSETLEQLRTFHILNGQEIRSIASKFIS